METTDAARATPRTLDYEADLCGNIEQALKGLQGYDIMALELIQNADDAGATRLSFDSRSDRLVIRNDALFSSCGSLGAGRCLWERSGGPDGRRRPCNFHAIARMGGRSKMGSGDQIGRFGIGFVSVYQVTDTPIIRSTGVELVLDPLDGRGRIAEIANDGWTEFDLPWAATETDIRAALNASPTPPDVAAIVADSIAATLRSSLLFLRRLERVDVLSDGVVRLSARIDRSGSEVSIDFGPHGLDRWLVLRGEASDAIDAGDLETRFEALGKLDRSREVEVAIAVGAEQLDGRLYAYLPTERPSGMPLHVNADFFPHASRQEIVLKGGGHEQLWNEALLETAAAVIGRNILTLRDVVGPARLWEIGSAALRMQKEEAFGVFWTEFADAARANPVVWTVSRDWRVPEGAYLAGEDVPDVEQAAIVDLGLQLVHQSLRPHASALAAVGAGELRLSTFAAAFEAGAAERLLPAGPALRAVWSAVSRSIAGSANRVGFAGVVARLKAASFVVDIEGRLMAPDALWKTPTGVDPRAVRSFLPDLPLVDDAVSAAPELAGLVDELDLATFAANLAAGVDTVEDAERVVGARARDLYSLLVAFAATSDDVASAAAVLADRPILRTANGFVPPSRGRLPGHFRDPTGRFELVDVAQFPLGMEEFARRALGVDVLHFDQYVDRHLPAILDWGPSREQYREIVAQIVARKNELDERGTLSRLRERAFVRTRAGTYARPGDCYYWTAQLETLVGDDAANWVDASWMPASPLASQTQDLFEHRLDMPVTVTPRHIVERIGALVADATPDQAAERITPIVRHVLERWTRFDDEDLDAFRDLQDTEFLPAIVDGARDPERLFAPAEVYRAGRAPGFASQVPVIDLTPLRQAGAAVTALLDLLEVPEEPPTAVVVAHLLDCMDRGIAPSDLTYTILNERVDEGDDATAVEALAGSRFIFAPELDGFVAADHVFWLPPPLKGKWWQASGRMALRPKLFTLLGVKDAPGVADYARLMLELASRADLTVEDLDVHSRCVAALRDAVENDEPGLDEALADLASGPSLLTVDGDAIWPEDAIWRDSEPLAEPFGSALDRWLVVPPDDARSGVARLFRRLGVRALSSLARLRLASDPDRSSADEATTALRDRADLLLWVAPNDASRRAMRDLLSVVAIQTSDALTIQAEIVEFDPKVVSPVSAVPAFLETDTGVLHLQGGSVQGRWPAAFRAIFAEFEHLCPLADVKPLVATATLIMLSASRDDAEAALLDSGFRRPASGPVEEPGETLRDGEYVELDQEESAQSDERSGEASNPDPSASAGETGSDAGPYDDAPDETPAGHAQAGTGGGGVGGGIGSYRSKSGSDAFRKPSETTTTATGGGGAADANRSANAGGGPAFRGGREGAEHRPRTSRMRSYVARQGDRKATRATAATARTSARR